MIDPQDIATLRELTAVQRARKANWQGQDQPRDAAMEHEHRERLDSIIEQLSARQELAGTSEPSAGPDPLLQGGVVTGPAANFFRRIVRRIFSRNACLSHGEGSATPTPEKS